MRGAYVLVGVAALVAGCAERASDVGGPVELPVVVTSHGGEHGEEGEGNRGRPTAATDLTGSEEVPPRQTMATGIARLRYNAARGEIFFRLEVRNITNVVQAHIHVGPVGVNGPVVAFLFGPVSPGGGFRRELGSTGEIQASKLLGPLAGMTVADLWAEISRGNAYVNVHTDDGVAPPDTGPGDFPGGEIRGQLAQPGR
jgi:hypothetical protein